MEKTVFLTVGTTQFDDLINCVLHDPNKYVLKALKEKGYTQLTIQSGKSPIYSTGSYNKNGMIMISLVLTQKFSFIKMKLTWNSRFGYTRNKHKAI